MKQIEKTRIAVLISVAAIGCAPGPAASDAPDAGHAIPPICSMGIETTGQPYRPLSDGDASELTVGYQGFMLTLVRVRAESGRLPDAPKVRMTVELDDMPPTISTLTRAVVEQDGAGRDITGVLEMWMTPPDPFVYEGRQGRLSVELIGRGSSCLATARVRYEDRELCKHSEDGTVVCVRDKE